ncbi:MAG: response regulator [Nitrospinota bacterium]
MLDRVLIVDDDPTIATFAKLILEKNGHYQVDLASSGEEALAMIEDNRPDIILLDVIMPGMDGFKTTEKLKLSNKTDSIPIIMITSKSEVDDKLKGMKLGANDYVTKPFNPDELIGRVNTQLRIKRLEKESGDKKELAAVLKIAAAIQHEINNPLTGIIGNIELLQEWRHLDHDELDQSLDEIAKLSIRVKDIVAKMSSLKKIVSTEYLPGNEMVDIGESSVEIIDDGNI